MSKFERFMPPEGPETPEAKQKKEAREELEKLIPELEDRGGLLVNKLENERQRGELSPELLGVFVEVMRGRIAKEMGQEKTTLPKEKLQQLDEELQVNPEAARAIIESFGYGVASDTFMLYGLIGKSKDLIRREIKFYSEVRPSVMVGEQGRTIADYPDEEILRGLYEFWDTEDIGIGATPQEFLVGDDIRYFSGKDVKIDKEEAQFRGVNVIPGFRHIFGPTRKRLMDYTREVGITKEAIQWLSRESINEFAVQFRDNSDVAGSPRKMLVTGYPAEWYIPGKNKSRVLKDYFKRYLLPQIRKGARGRGIS